MKFKNFKVLNSAFKVAVMALFLGFFGEVFAKSIWQNFVDFFSPTEKIEGEGPLYDELRELDKNIGRVEGQYSRERRPVHKKRYKKELDSLTVVKENLLKKINENNTLDSTKKLSSSSVKISSSSEAKNIVHSKIDTVFIRDTIIIHDTIFVMIAPKPTATKEDSIKVDSTTIQNVITP